MFISVKVLEGSICWLLNDLETYTILPFPFTVISQMLDLTSLNCIYPLLKSSIRKRAFIHNLGSFCYIAFAIENWMLKPNNSIIYMICIYVFNIIYNSLQCLKKCVNWKPRLVWNVKNFYVKKLFNIKGCSTNQSFTVHFSIYLYPFDTLFPIYTIICAGEYR